MSSPYRADSLRVVLISFSILLVLSGCVAPTSQSTIESLARQDSRARILLMAPDVELYEISAAGVPEPKGEWTLAARRFMRDAIHLESATRDLNAVEFDEEALAADQRPRVHQIVKLANAVGRAILVHTTAPVNALPTKQGRLDWTVGESTRLLRDASAADYGLFIHVRDSYSSPGRVAVIIVGALLGVGIPGGSQIGYATLVDLNTGQVVWFNRLFRGVGDLRTAEPALETVRALLEGMPR